MCVCVCVFGDMLSLPVLTPLSMSNEYAGQPENNDGQFVVFSSKFISLRTSFMLRQAGGAELVFSVVRFRLHC